MRTQGGAGPLPAHLLALHRRFLRADVTHAEPAAALSVRLYLADTTNMS